MLRVREEFLSVIASKLVIYGGISGKGVGMHTEIVAHKPLMTFVPGALLDNVKVESNTLNRGRSPQEQSIS